MNERGRYRGGMEGKGREREEAKGGGRENMEVIKRESVDKGEGREGMKEEDAKEERIGSALQQ